MLHRYDWSESSLIVEVFTREHGRIALIAKGAKDVYAYITHGVLSGGALSSYLADFDQKAAQWPAFISSAFPRFHDIYQRARHALLAEEVDDETLALDVIAAVGPGGHFLAQEHTRTHMRTSLKRGLTHELAQGRYRDPVEVAREKVAWIRANHHPEPLGAPEQAELTRILVAADGELAG